MSTPAPYSWAAPLPPFTRPPATPPASRLCDLEPAIKQALWSAIKQQRPALAQMMTEDLFIKDFQKKFNAEFVMTDADIDQLTGGEQ